ncbi:MAG TPA: glycosyltransferase family 39 protein, partial [Polyangiaceae bacterium]|nr:glycosyltransferase family 39 protein [Polyangiaceae bacterium]
MTDGSARGALDEREVEEARTSKPELEFAQLPEGSAEHAQAAPAPAATDEAAKPAPQTPLHLVRGTLLLLAGAVIPFCIMAADRRFGFSVPLGCLGCAISTCGALDLFGTFDERPNTAVTRVETTATLTRFVELIAAGVVHVVALRLAVAGALPKPILSAAVLVPASFLWVVVAGFRVAQSLGSYRLDELGAERNLLRRHGFWLLVLNALLYLPMLGSFSLSDPWETHYGEVAREMLARDDWISLWWAQDGWFWSKPVLDFWMQALAFSLLGVRYMPDQMLASVAEGRFPQPEWAARMPVFLLTVLGAYFLYKGVAKAFGRRAGFLGGLVLTTMPYWYLLAHQTMTDMPYVAPLAASMGLLMLGFQSDPNREVSVYRLSLGRFKIEVSAFHVLFGAILLCVLPQVLYLLTRNVTLQFQTEPHGFRWHLDEFFSGSGGGNCGLPGNEPCQVTAPRTKN